MTSFLVTSVVGNVLTLASPLDQTYPSGTTVGVAASNVTLTVPASTGDTQITVTDGSAVVVGSIIGVTDLNGVTEYRTVTAVEGNVVTLAAALGGSYATGSGAAQSGPFLTGLMICDKAGNVLGSIQDYVINDTRSFSLGEPGSMTFYLPRNSADISMVQSDRLVALSNDVGMPLWVGSIGTQEWSSGSGNIHCEDAYSLLAGVPIELDMEILDGQLATTVYKAVMDLVNARRGLDGEIQWQLDLQGAKPFLGDFSFSGDPDDALRTIADRSGTEYAWLGGLSGGKLVLTLQVRDTFTAPAGVALTDGAGGNVVSSPTYQIDPTTIINGLRLTGDQTTIKDYVDDWAEWAVHDIEPVVEIYVDTGDFRRRIDLDVSVDFSLSGKTQRSLAQKTSDQVWEMYERYLYAIHDIRGTINHPGWVYEGPPEAIEPQLTKDKWHTHVELAKFREGRPAAIVMKSDDSWLVVTYNVTFTTKFVKIYGFESTYTEKKATINVGAGSHTIYDESGGRAQVYTIYNSGGEQWVVDLNTITARLASGARITLRGIRTPDTLRGRYIDVNESGYSGFNPFDPIPNVDDDGSQIGHIWPIERSQIRQWDPRRDGIGAYLNRTTVYSGHLTTRRRWHIVPYSTGEEAQTVLDSGVFVVDVTGTDPLVAGEIYVESGQGFPLDNLPFTIIVGDPLDGDEEIMKVYEAFGNRWKVNRGQSITGVTTTADVGAGATVMSVTSSAGFVTSMSILVGTETRTVEDVGPTSITVSTPLSLAHLAGTAVTTQGFVKTHPPGSMVRLLYGVPFDGFKYPYTWPEGEAYAQNLLARLSRPSRLITVSVSNENDDWRTFQYGSVHTVDIQSEGPPGGITGTARCVGFSPNEDAGSMEVLMEMLA